MSEQLAFFNTHNPDLPPPQDEKAWFQDYYLKIEQVFSAFRTRNILLSPNDYSVAQDWHNQGIPLSCVLRGIREAFYKKMQRDDDSNVFSLSYCMWAVLDEWKQYQSFEPQSNSNGTAPDPTKVEVGKLLDALAFDLLRAKEGLESERIDNLAETVKLFALQVQSISHELPLDQIEEQLQNNDDRLMNLLVEHCPRTIRSAINASVSRKLKQMKLDKAQHEKSFEAAVRSKIRGHFKIPKLTLYRL